MALLMKNLINTPSLKQSMAKKRNVIIMGAAGRDFHDFNVFFRKNPDYKVACFTAAQIPDIAGRKYPAKLAGKLYPKGIPIYTEDKLPELIKKHKIDTVILSYSDLKHEDVMHKASIILSNGAGFQLLGPDSTMIKSKVPIVSVCAVRTGCGKSQTSRKVANYFKKRKYKVVIIRHPMPYGDLAKQAVQRFATYKDLEKHNCTIEEREEYEPHINNGIVVYAGVDYEKILKKAEKEADIIIWDGGNNDLPFYKPDLHIVVVDPHRPRHELLYHPGEANFRMADVIVINKAETAKKLGLNIVRNNIKKINPKAKIITAASPLIVTNFTDIKNKDVIVIEDGPTLTHGEMAYGVATLAAKKYKANILDAEKYAVGSLKKLYKKFHHLSKVLPAMGYGKRQMKELESTINKSNCDVVISGTPINLGRLLKINKPIVNVGYELEETSKLKLSDVLSKVKVKRKKKLNIVSDARIL